MREFPFSSLQVVEDPPASNLSLNPFILAWNGDGCKRWCQRSSLMKKKRRYLKTLTPQNCCWCSHKKEVCCDSFLCVACLLLIFLNVQLFNILRYPRLFVGWHTMVCGENQSTKMTNWQFITWFLKLLSK